MEKRVKYLLGQMDSISKDYDAQNIYDMNSLIDSTPNSK